MIRIIWSGYIGLIINLQKYKARDSQLYHLITLDMQNLNIRIHRDITGLSDVLLAGEVGLELDKH